MCAPFGQDCAAKLGGFDIVVAEAAATRDIVEAIVTWLKQEAQRDAEQTPVPLRAARRLRGMQDSTSTMSETFNSPVFNISVNFHTIIHKRRIEFDRLILEKSRLTLLFKPLAAAPSPCRTRGRSSGRW